MQAANSGASRGLTGLGQQAWRQRGTFLPGLACLVLSDLCQLLVPACIQRGVDAVTVGGSWAQVRLQVAFIFGLTLVTIVMRFLWRHFFFTGARLAEVEMRQRLLAHALALPAGHYSKTRTGELMAALEGHTIEFSRSVAFPGKGERFIEITCLPVRDATAALDAVMAWLDAPATRNAAAAAARGFVAAHRGATARTLALIAP